MPNNSSTKNRDGKEDWRSVVERLKSHLESNAIEKLFEEQQFIFELIKILYEDVDFRTKIYILLTIEQEICGLIAKTSVDQIITALIDIFETEIGNFQSLEIRVQLLITITTIFIENDEFMDQELGSNFISKMIDLLRKTNVIPTRRLRAIVCNCLIQIEEWKPGILLKWKDSLTQLSRDEKTDICQDYLHLLIIVIKNVQEEPDQDGNDKGIMQTVSYIMDNMYLFTGPGALNIINSVIGLVISCPGISPSLFKPMKLQCIPCMEPSIFYLMLFIQNRFRGEILSFNEEQVLLLKTLGVLSHAAISSKTRLLAGQWLISYLQKHNEDLFLEQLQRESRPTVFDPLNVHSCKLLLHCLVTPPKDSKVICQDLHYLNQVTSATGGIRVTCALYRILYAHVCHHNSETVHANALSITKNLFQKFPHLIPLIVDFLQTLQATQSNMKFHLVVLSLLHNTVLSVTLSSLLANYQNFLQVWILSAQNPNMHLQKQLKRMLELASEAHSLAIDDWTLGCLLLSICRTMMLHHQTDIFYIQMGDLLFYMMNNFSDPDIQDQARFYYALLTLTSNVKAKEILNADLVNQLKFGENLAELFPGSMAQILPSDIRILDVSPISCSRKNVSVVYQEINKPVGAEKDFFQSYLTSKVNFKTVVRCNLSVSIKEESEMDNLIATTIDISSVKNAILIEEIQIPFLSKKEESYVSFQFTPSQPVPCVLDLRSCFSHEKATFQCNMDSIHLNISDFMVPFPWQQFAISDNNQESLFNSIWNRCTSTQNGECCGVESVKILPCNSQRLALYWKDAQVIWDPKGTSTICFLFLLVPSFHFLFRASDRGSDSVVEIASDFPQVLEYVDQFLEDLIITEE